MRKGKNIKMRKFIIILLSMTLFTNCFGKIGDGSFSRKITAAGKIFTGELIKDGW